VRSAASDSTDPLEGGPRCLDRPWKLRILGTSLKFQDRLAVIEFHRNIVRRMMHDLNCRMGRC
jgi:hypothetical protein